MRSPRLIVTVMVALALLATPALAHEAGKDTVTHAASKKMRVQITWAPEHVNQDPREG